MLRILFIYVYLAIVLQGYGQQKIELSIRQTDSALIDIRFKNSFSTVAELKKYVQTIPGILFSEGNIAAALDSVIIDSPRATIYIYVGTRYTWQKLTVNPEFKPLAYELALPGHLNGKKRKVLAGSDYKQKVLDFFSDNGYPFAEVGYDSVQIKGNKLRAHLSITKGVYYKIDSIAQLGVLRLQSKFLNNYLGIIPGSAYNASQLEKISQRLNELPFALQQQPWELNMVGTGAVVNTYLAPRKSNVIDVLIGVMPSSTQTENNKVQVTGDANILLRNSFRMGETIGLNWQQIQYKSPRLNLSYIQPFIFGSKAGADFLFELFKKDSQFVNLQLRVGMPYQFSVNNTGKVLFHYRQSNILTLDTQFVLQNKQLPDLTSSSSTSLGFDYQVNNTNYRLNPSKGTDFQISFTGGTKTLRPQSGIVDLENPDEPDYDYSSLYDSAGERTYQFRIKLDLARYFSAGRSWVLKLATSIATYESGNYFRNELYQIGGFRLLRGFDEESIYARRYGVFTAEYRLLSGRNSYFFGFVDAGFAQYRDQLESYWHQYTGTGLGLVLETGRSLLNISWAFGKRNDLPLDLRQSKIHLGIVNFF